LIYAMGGGIQEITHYMILGTCKMINVYFQAKIFVMKGMYLYLKLKIIWNAHLKEKNKLECRFMIQEYALRVILLMT